MSKFENYNVKSRDYDKLRVTMGIDVVAAMVTMQSKKEVKDIRLLDAGCGTGIPARTLLDCGFEHLTLMDASTGMLEQARNKLDTEIKEGKVEKVVEASLPTIPFTDKCFDAVMYSMVLHHLENAVDGSFNCIVETLTEAHRVLTDDGTLALVTPLPFGMVNAVWWMKLLPEVTKRYVKRFPTMDQWEDIFVRSNFRCVNKLSLLGPEVFGPGYFDGEGPSKKEWRNAISYFATTSDDEIKELEEKIKKMKVDGTLDDYIFSNDKTNEIGTVCVLICKPIH